jgi:hypothetical protein
VKDTAVTFYGVRNLDIENVDIVLVGYGCNFCEYTRFVGNGKAKLHQFTGSNAPTREISPGERRCGKK